MRTTTEINKELEMVSREFKNWERVQNEGAKDGYNPFEVKIEELSSEWSKAKEYEEDMEWTREVTAKRRELWNIEVKKIKGSFTGQDVLAITKKLGFRMETLKKYIAKYA